MDVKIRPENADYLNFEMEKVQGFLPALYLSPHSTKRLRQYTSSKGAKKGTRTWQGETRKRLLLCLQSGVKLDWEGAVHVRVQHLVAVCIPDCHKGGWVVKTYYPAGGEVAWPHPH